MKRQWLVTAVLLGALVRLAALPLPGTRDAGVWKIWTYNAALHSPTTLYGVGGSPPERRVLDFHGAETTVDYPPLALYELAVVGRAYRRLNPAFIDNTALTIAIKVPLLLAELGFLLLAYGFVRAKAGLAAARWATVAYWLNPAPIMDATVLGYLDPLFVLPAAAALVAGAAGWPFVAGVMFALAVLTKAQAIVVLPAVALAIWKGGADQGGLRRAALAAGGAALATAAVAGPVIARGAGRNMIASLQSLTRHDMLSGNACNLWWIIGYLVRVRHSYQDMGVWAAFTAPAKILAISRVVEIGYPNPRLIGGVLAASAMIWAVWMARRSPDQLLLIATGAFAVHAYATLSAQVHENHLFAAIPLLAIAAAGRPRLRPVFWMLSAVFALNLNLFYGISEYIDGYAVPRAVTIIDLTVVLALINCAALLWHAHVFRIECSTAAALRRATGRA